MNVSSLSKKVVFSGLAIWIASGGWSLAFAADPASYDIVGIHIGDTVEHVRERIQQFDPKIKVVNSRWTAKPGLPTSTSHLFGLVNKLGGNRERFDGSWKSYIKGINYDDFVQVTFGQVTKSAHSIVRSSGNENKNPMLLSALESALVEKYGKPHAVRDAGFIWAFGENSQPVKKPELCDISTVDDMDEGRLLLQSKPDCGLVVQVNYLLDSPNVVSTYEVVMLDYGLLLKDVKLREEQEKAWMAQEQERRINELTNNKPRL